MDRLSDIEHVVPELRHGRETQISPPTSRLDQWLTTLTKHTGSDLLLIPGAPACIRLEGEVRAIDSETLDRPEIEAAVVPALTPHGLEQYREMQIADCSDRVAAVGRFRINLYVNGVSQPRRFAPCPRGYLR